MNYLLLLSKLKLILTTEFISSRNFIKKLTEPILNVYNEEKEAYNGFVELDTFKNDIYIIFEFNVANNTDNSNFMLDLIRGILKNYNEFHNNDEFYFKYEKYKKNSNETRTGIDFLEFLSECFVCSDQQNNQHNEITFDINSPELNVIVKEKINFGFICNQNMSRNNARLTDMIKNFTVIRNKIKFANKVLCLALQSDMTKNNNFLLHIYTFFGKHYFDFFYYTIWTNIRILNLRKKFNKRVLQRFDYHNLLNFKNKIHFEKLYREAYETLNFKLIIDFYYVFTDELLDFFDFTYSSRVIRCFKIFFGILDHEIFNFYVVITWNKQIDYLKTKNSLKITENLFLIKDINFPIKVIASFSYYIDYFPEHMNVNNTNDRICNLYLENENYKIHQKSSLRIDNNLFNLFELQAELQAVSDLYLNYHLEKSNIVDRQTNNLHVYNLIVNKNTEIINPIEYKTFKIFFKNLDKMLNVKKEILYFFRKYPNLEDLFLDGATYNPHDLPFFVHKTKYDRISFCFEIESSKKHFFTLFDNCSLHYFFVGTMIQNFLKIKIKNNGTIEKFFYAPELTAYENIYQRDNFLSMIENNDSIISKNDKMKNVMDSNYHFVFYIKTFDNKTSGRLFFYYFENYYDKFVSFYNKKDIILSQTCDYFILYSKTGRSITHEEYSFAENLYLNDKNEFFDDNSNLKAEIKSVCLKIFDLLDCHIFFGLILNLKQNVNFVKGLIAYHILKKEYDEDTFKNYFHKFEFNQPSSMKFNNMIDFKTYCNEIFIFHIEKVINFIEEKETYEQIFTVFNIIAEKFLDEFKKFLIENGHNQLKFIYHKSNLAKITIN